MVALAVKQPVDQMQVARSAAARAHGQPPRQGRFGASGKSRRFFVAHVHPLNAPIPAQAVVDAVEAVARHPPHALDARVGKGLNQQIGNGEAHGKVLQSRK